MLGIVVTTPPTAEPVTLEEARLHLRVSDDSEDEQLDGLIKAAREYVETRIDRALMTQTIRLSLDRFPAYEIRLPKPPLQSVTSVQYIDGAGATQTVSASDYRVDTYTEPGRIEPVTVWPVADARVAAVRVTYVAGFTSAALVPQTIKQAMLLLMTHWYENRSAVGRPGGPVELAVASLLGMNWSGSYVGTYG